MNAIINWVDALTYALFKVEIVDFFKKVSVTKQDIKTAHKLAAKKKLIEATKKGQSTLSKWSNSPALVEQKLRQLLMGNLLTDFKSEINSWKQKIKFAKSMIASAQALEKSDAGDPLDTTNLSKALSTYKKCRTIIDISLVNQAIARCEHKMMKYNQFRTLFTEGQKYCQEKDYKKGKLSFERAKTLFPIPLLEEAIADCSGYIQGQNQYELALEKAVNLAKNGEFKAALNVINLALDKFEREDGQTLRGTLNRVMQGKDYYSQGLGAEKSGNLGQAISFYQKSYQLLPELTETQIRLAIVSLKTANWQQAIAHLQGHSGEKIKYLRGFAYLQQGDFQQAEVEWRSLSHPQVKSQLEIVRTLRGRDRLKLMLSIQQLVDDNNLDNAGAMSRQFLHSYGSDTVVEANLNNHILPRLEAKIWEGQDWPKIAQITEQVWLKNGDCKSLHNWAIATYYNAQINSHTRRDWVVAATTALANLERDPAWQNIPWLPKISIDIEEIFSHFLATLETAIDSLKDDNLAEYLKLRDQFRLDAIALKLVKKFPHQAAQINHLILLPGCYHRYRHQFSNIKIPQTSNSASTETNILPALYTSWGLAVAAAFDGDGERAIQLKPSRSYQFNSSQKNEYFAQKFLAYSEGIHYLQKQRWRESIAALNALKNEWRSHPEWHRELERLCESQRQALNSLSDHLAFSDFWYQLLGTEASCSYWVESRIQEICENLQHHKIDKNRALSQLRELQKTDSKNPRLIYVIETLEFEIEVNEIIGLMPSNLNDAVRRAKNCHNQKVKRHIAAMLIEILIAGVNEGKMNGETAVQFARWAHQICPNDPEFVDIYRQCGIY
ncbi:tetratricopeptide repeat protein [Limnospira fusiformis]|uniref:tetratricopeptide repeat protein n=1 Tax=Limnospira fusiformis TaxID=54297 RepID=UPI0014499658|nr:tetratricopeptide repeat protein [Limnospira fusiformis SAG 85.79]